MKKIKNIASIFFIFIYKYSFSQSYFYLPQYSVFSHQANLNSEQNSFESIFHTASLSEVKNNGLGVYGNTIYNLNNLFDAGVFFYTHIHKTKVATHIQSTQSDDLKSFLFQFIAAQKISKVWNVGINFNYFYVYSKSIATDKKTFFFDISNQFLLTENVNVYMNICNPVGGYLDKYINEKIARVIKVGAAYAYKKIGFSFEVVKQEEKKLGINGGFFITLPHDFRMGFVFESLNNIAFLSIKKKIADMFNINPHTNYHPVLGFSNGAVAEFIY